MEEQAAAGAGIGAFILSKLVLMLSFFLVGVVVVIGWRVGEAIWCKITGKDASLDSKLDRVVSALKKVIEPASNKGAVDSSPPPVAKQSASW